MAILQEIPAGIRFISYEPARATAIDEIGPSARLDNFGRREWSRRATNEAGLGSAIDSRLPQARRCIVPQAMGAYQNNPLVLERGMTVTEAKAVDSFGKGGGLIDGELIREFPEPRPL